MVAGFDKGGEKCVKDRTILTYSESANPNSKHYADQTRLFSQQEVARPALLPQPGREGGEEHEGDPRRLTGTSSLSHDEEEAQMSLTGPAEDGRELRPEPGPPAARAARARDPGPRRATRESELEPLQPEPAKRPRRTARRPAPAREAPKPRKPASRPRSPRQEAAAKKPARSPRRSRRSRAHGGRGAGRGGREQTDGLEAATDRAVEAREELSR